MVAGITNVTVLNGEVSLRALYGERFLDSRAVDEHWFIGGTVALSEIFLNLVGISSF